MPYRKYPDLPRLSGRPESEPAPPRRETQHVFRRFFDMLERLDKPQSGTFAPDSKGKSGTGKTTRR